MSACNQITGVDRYIAFKNFIQKTKSFCLAQAWLLIDANALRQIYSEFNPDNARRACNIIKRVRLLTQQTTPTNELRIEQQDHVEGELIMSPRGEAQINLTLPQA